LVCAAATARAIARSAPASVTLVATGVFPGRDGDEDIACADYLAALLQNPLAASDSEPLDLAALVRRVRESDAGRLFANPADPVFPASDLDLCTDVDRFDFALQVERCDGLLVMRAAE